MRVHTVCKRVEGTTAVWELTGAWGEVLRLPASDAEALAKPFQIGLLGTRTSKKVTKKTKKLGAMLADLRRPLYVIDTRRNGAGGSGSWGPREFASQIPGMLGRDAEGRYGFMHLPCLAPSLELLEAYRAAAKVPSTANGEQIAAGATQAGQGVPVDGALLQHWQVFAARYRRELPEAGILAARAFVEAAHGAGGLAIFLCAEAHLDDFDHADQTSQDEHYCHRYTLARAVAASIQADVPSAAIEVVDLRIDAPPVHRSLAAR